MRKKIKKKLYILTGTFVIASFTGTIIYNLINKNIINSKDMSYDKDLLAVYVQGDDGNYTQSNSSTFPTDGYMFNASKSSCVNGGKLTQNITTKKINLTTSSTDKCTLYFDKDDKSSKTLKHLGLTSNGIQTEFDEPATTDEGIFEMKDDYGISYYYRGAVTNNYVKFAGFYWRIIRINGDGSLRIIYDGTSAHANGESSDDRFTHTFKQTNQVYNANPYDVKHVGWMYGPADKEDGTTIASTSKEETQTNTEDSTIKKVVDE